MEGLGPYIYHERQEPGSMMCGQHALNNLLQGNYFTPPVLAEIAQKLDEMERGVSETPQRSGRSTNMDDTGYFSVQVLEEALKEVFGLTLVRWRSEEMRQFQAAPDTQLAFILNLEQHWFTLRRFGRPGGKGFWFNLNSFLSTPEWVGNTYLGMVLQQAEQEGYSVFAVRPLDPNNPEHILPETEGDLLAETLDGTIEGQRPTAQLSTSRTHSGSAAIEPSASSSARSPPPTGLEGEDVELQRALQASIAAGYGAGTVYEFPDEPTTYRTTASSSRSGGLGLGYGGDVSSRSSSGPPSRRTPIPTTTEAEDPPTPQFDDPVAASAARSRARLEQMQREQAMAMQGLGGYGFGAGMAEATEMDPVAARRRREAQDRVRRAREEEEEQVRRAMAESLAAHEGRQVEVDVEGDDDDDEPRYFVTPPTATTRLPPSGGDRNYDDEDAELQAALKASLEEHNAGGASGSNSVPLVPVPRVSTSAPSQIPAKPTADEDDDQEDEDEEEEATPAPSSPEVETKAVVADPDELRRRRLARFGG